MSANIEIQNDAGVPVTAHNFGAVKGGEYQQAKFKAENAGNQLARSVRIYVQRLGGNDGLDFAQITSDSGGNPAAPYTSSPLSIGDLASGAIYEFWVKVTIPTGTTPAGNPRQFDIIAEYSGT